MVSPNERQTFTKVIKFVSKLKIYPFDWYNNELHTKTNFSIKVRHLIFILISLTLFGEDLFQVYKSTVQNQILPLSLYGFLLPEHVSALVLKWLIWLHSGEMVFAINQTLYFDRTLEKLLGLDAKLYARTRNKIWEKFIGVAHMIFGSVGAGCAIFQTICFYNFTMERLFNTDELWHVEKLIILSFASFAYIGFYIDYNPLVQFFVFTTVFATFNAKDWLKKISKDVKYLQAKSPIQIYRIVYIYSNSLFLTFGKDFFVYCVNCLAFSCLTILLFILISFRTQVSITIFALLFCTTLIVLGGIWTILVELSEIYHLSGQVKNFWLRYYLGQMNRNDRKLKLREWKAALIIRAKVGNFYYMESNAKLSALKNLIEGVVFLLVST